MSDEIQTKIAPKPKRRKITTPRAPKTIDPAITQLRIEYRQKVAVAIQSRNSARILKTIIEKRIPKMIQAHRQDLFDALAKSVTPPLDLHENPSKKPSTNHEEG